MFFKYFFYLLKDGTSGDAANLPRVTQNAPVVTDFPEVMNYKWEKIFSSNSSLNLSSLYLVTTDMRNDMNKNFEKVLFLVNIILFIFLNNFFIKFTSLFLIIISTISYDFLTDVNEFFFAGREEFQKCKNVGIFCLRCLRVFGLEI